MKAAEIQELEERQKSLVKGQRELQTSLEGTTKALIKNQKAYQDLADEIDRVLTKINNLKGAQGKMQNRVVEEDSREIIGSQQENDSFWKTPWKVGLLNMAGQAITNAGEAYLNSWLGPTTGNQISTVLGSVVSGAVMGSVGGLPGAVIGGLVGGVAGIANAAVQTFTNQDEAYKAAVKEFYSDAMEKQKQSLQNGTAIAARRETDQISISRLLREDADVQGYMESIQQKANATPFQYEELVSLSKTLAPGFGTTQTGC